MSADLIDRAFGRQAFGTDPGRYHAARAAYPDWVFEVLCGQCGLADGTTTFEIGAGTGTATRRLLDRCASPLVAVEPDPRMATYLRETIPDEALKVIFSLFEEAALDAGSFDLGISATAFHWLDEATALTKIAELFRPGGWWAMDWNVFGDDNRPGADVRRAIPPSLALVQTTVLAPVRDYASLGSSAVGGPRRRVTPFFPVTLFFATALGFPA